MPEVILILTLNIDDNILKIEHGVHSWRIDIMKVI